MNKSMEYNTELDWRPLTAQEADILTQIYQRQRKMIAWFFYIWCGMGVFVISLGSIVTIIDVVKGNSPLGNLLTIPVAIIFAGSAFIAFPLWILKYATMREIKAIRDKSAFMCETPVVDMRESITYKDHHKKVKYKFMVNLPYTIEPFEVEGSGTMFENTKVGDTILIFAPLVETPQYHKAYPLNFVEEYGKGNEY